MYSYMFALVHLARARFNILDNNMELAIDSYGQVIHLIGNLQSSVKYIHVCLHRFMWNYRENLCMTYKFGFRFLMF